MLPAFQHKLSKCGVFGRRYLYVAVRTRDKMDCDPQCFGQCSVVRSRDPFFFGFGTDQKKRLIVEDLWGLNLIEGASVECVIDNCRRRRAASGRCGFR